MSVVRQIVSCSLLIMNMRPYVSFLTTILCTAVSTSSAISSITVYSKVDVKILQQLVEINSGSTNIKGIETVQNLLAEQLKEIGFAIEYKLVAETSMASAPLLIATRYGTSNRFVTLAMHADTVFETSASFRKLILSQDGKTAKGPGVIDDKGSVWVALNGLKQFFTKTPKPSFSVRVISSPSEETGSERFISDFKMFSQDSFLVLGFEPAFEDGSIIQSRRGNKWYKVQVTGKEAHAGRAFTEGANASMSST